MVIRPITSRDAALLKAVTLESVREAPYAFGGEQTYAEEVVRPDEHWQNFAAELDAQVPEWRDCCVGYFLMDGLQSRGKVICTLAGCNPKLALITGMWIDPACRRQGFGRKLVDVAIQWSATHGAERLKLWVDDTNPEGVRFYQSLGFTATGDSRAVSPDSNDLERSFVKVLERTREGFPMKTL